MESRSKHAADSRWQMSVNEKLVKLIRPAWEDQRMRIKERNNILLKQNGQAEDWQRHEESCSDDHDAGHSTTGLLDLPTPTLIATSTQMPTLFLSTSTTLTTQRLPLNPPLLQQPPATVPHSFQYQYRHFRAAPCAHLATFLSRSDLLTAQVYKLCGACQGT